MFSQNYDEKREGKFHKTRASMIRAIKDRKRVEMEYLDAVKKQIWYWKTQIGSIDPEKDEERYNEIKKNIESEKAHIEQVEDELNRINEELEAEMKNK